MTYPMPDPNPHPTGPHGPRTWPASASPAAIAAEIAATPRAMPPRPTTGMPPHVYPRPMTDPALVGTVHDSRRPAGPPDVPQLPASG